MIGKPSNLLTISSHSFDIRFPAISAGNKGKMLSVRGPGWLKLYSVVISDLGYLGIL
jgi:hypothetical protein